MRRLFFAAALVALAAAAARAQETPRVEVFGGYAYGGSDAHGWNASVAVNVKDWLGLVTDLGGQYTRVHTPDSFERIRTHSALFGPRFSLRRKRRVTPFAHVLVGVGHNDARAREAGFDFHFTDTAFAAALGGGLDVRLSEHVALRAFQADYLRTNFFGGSQNNGRLSAGLVLRFGRR